MNYLLFGAFVVLVVIVFYRYATRSTRVRTAALAQPFPEDWRQFLTERVAFYLALKPENRQCFEQQVQVFLAQTPIRGIQTEVDDPTRLLVAASAIIPIFGFSDWEYTHLGEVLIVPDAWQQPDDPAKEIKPLAGTLLGSVQGFQGAHYMRLSKASLEQGFADTLDKKNVGIHEFAHLLDEADGVIDGVPGATLPPALLKAWTEVTHREIEAIRAGQSEISSYGGTSAAEFFAVVSEYFFEKPETLQQHHPELYDLLTQLFHQNPKKRFLRPATDPRTWIRSLRSRRKKFGRNSPCPCGSGKKYKDCHLKPTSAPE